MPLPYEIDRHDDRPTTKIGGSAMTGAEAIAAERQRQIEAEGWTPEHDDRHGEANLARAAACYAVYGSRMTSSEPPTWWPFNPIWWKPKNRRADLVRSGALIAAEIDRLDRLALPSPDK